jgi:mono/diheme cytochrome c family protein
MKNLVLKASLLFLVVGLMLPAYTVAADAGADLFKAKCQMCHGPAGDASNSMAKTMKLAPLSSADVQKLSDAELADVIVKGKGKMKPVAGVTPEQAKDVVKYLRTLKK